MKVFELYVEVIDWHDGDTFHGIIDQGFDTYRGSRRKPKSIRCYGIDAPELHTELGGPSLSFAQSIAPAGEYACLSYPPTQDSFGRPLLDLILPGDELFSHAMIEAGYAVYFVPRS